MNCFDVASNLQLFLDEELPDQERSSMQQHFTACPECEQKLNNEKKLKEALHNIERKTAGESVLEMVRGVLLQNA